MINRKQRGLLLGLGLTGLTAVLLLAGCTAAKQTAESEATAVLVMPKLEAAAAPGEKLQVIATTSIIGDVVAQVGGGAIDLTVLIGPGQDPHSYEPGAQELTAVSNADVIFVNGWNLEEGLMTNLEAIGDDMPIVPVAANIEPLAFGGDEHDEEGEHAHNGADPHTWQSVHHVEQWVENIQHSLSSLDPANADVYAQNAETYLEELAELESYATAQLATIPADKRVLVTNHDALAYFAHDYEFEILGTIIPGASTLADPSASDLAELIAAMDEHGVCTMFTEAIVSDSLAQTVAAELNHCDEVQVLSLYTDALGETGSGTDSYIGMFRANVDAIVVGLGG